MSHWLASGIAGFARLIAGSRAFWPDENPPVWGQHIFYANHSSHLDAVVLWASLDPAQRDRTRPVAAHEYWRATRVRRFLAVEIFRCVLVKREGFGRAGIEAMYSALDAGDSLIFFPEGTRGSGEAVVDLRAGLYHLCVHRPEADAIPVYLENLNRILPKGELIPVPLLSRVLFGRPLRLATGETKAVFLERARQVLLELREHP